MTVLVAWTCAVLIAAGVVVAWFAIVGTETDVVTRRRRRRPRLGTGVGAAVAAVGLAAVTRWPALAVAVVAAAWAVPRVVARRREDADYAARLAATRDWLLALRSLLLAGEGLEQALVATARLQPSGGALREPLRLLVLRLDRTTAAEALRRFAVDVDNHVGDAAVLTLLHAVTHGSRELSTTLAALGEWAREEVALIERVAAERRGLRTSQAIILGVFAVMPVTFAVTAPEQLATFGTALGQVVLAVILAAAAGCVVWMSAIVRPHRPPRFFDPGVAR